MAIDPETILTLIIGRKRYALWGIALILLLIFVYSIKEYPLVKNTLNYFYDPPKTITFNSGTPGGIYNSIGESLSRKELDSNIKVNNNPTPGSIANITTVSRVSNSFGIVQADTLVQTDTRFVQVNKDNIQLITPLYMEYMHLLMRKKIVEKFDTNQESFLRDILKDRVISTGSFLSGTNSMAAAILNAETISPLKNLYNINLKEGLDLLRFQDKCKIGALFFMSGTPVPLLKEEMNDNRKGHTLTLVPVTGSFPSILQQDRDLPIIRSTISSEDYTPDVENNMSTNGTSPWLIVPKDVSTIGTPAWLIASKDVSTDTILIILEGMQGILKDPEYELNITNAIKKYTLIKESESEGVYSRVAVFSTTILTTWVALIFLLVVIYSKWRQKIYFSRMHTIYENYLHLYTEPDKESGGYKHYDVELKDGKTRLNNLVQGISMLNSLVKEIRTDYRNGTLMIMDMRFLFDRLYGIIEIFHRHVAQHMFLLINLYKSNSEDTDELLVLLNQHYVTSYVTQNDYDWLKELLEPKPESDGDKEDKNGS